MRFPVTVRHRDAKAKIYGKSKSYEFYRVAFKAGGKRVVRSFGSYSDALKEAEAKVREISNGNQTLALSPKEAADALAIRDALAAFKRETGRTVTALQAVTHYVHTAKVLGERPLSEAVEGYLRTVASLKRKPLSEAVEHFIASREPKTKAKDGKRAQLCAKYAGNVASWLRAFAAMLPGHAVSDLSKEHLTVCIRSYRELSAKSRNDRRAALKMFLSWCVRQDYLSATHRLSEADEMQREQLDGAAIDYYRPAELRGLLDASEGQMRAVISLQALAGLRLQEALRLDWSDVFGIAGHIEVSTAKSKTRQRRLVEIYPALSAWLEPYRACKGRVWTETPSVNGYVSRFAKLAKRLEVPSRRNGLRHGFVTFHFALHSNENLTSALAGNSPAMIHAHYRGLATKAEAEKWFSVAPTRAGNVISIVASKT